MQAVNTLISSNLVKRGTRVCDLCGSDVPIWELNGVENSRCLTCDNKALESEMRIFKNKMDLGKGQWLFEKQSIIPSDLLKASFENYRPADPTQQDALNTSKWFVKNFGLLKEGYDWNSLLFKGSYGVGKSHLSYSIAKGVKDQGFSVIFIDTPSLLQMIRDTFSKSKRLDRIKEDVYETEIFRTIAKVDLFILDDLGAEYIKQDGESWGTEVIFRIVTSRMDKPNIITTNCSSDELIQKYGNHGGRILSRIMNGTKKVEVNGKDHRIKGW